MRKESSPKEHKLLSWSSSNRTISGKDWRSLWRPLNIHLTSSVSLLSNSWISIIIFTFQFLGKLEANDAALSQGNSRESEDAAQISLHQQHVTGLHVDSEMICSSATAERTSTFKFIHSRLRNRLTNERVRKLVFLYTNYVLLDNKDKNDYILEDGAVLSGIDCGEND